MGKRMRFVAGAMAGAVMQYLFDPQVGRTRRVRLADQAAARMRDLKRGADRKLRYQKGRIQGLVYETFERGEGDAPADDEVVLQRIRSSVIGPYPGDLSGLDLRIESGVVILTGTAPQQVRRNLVDQIRQVAGVRGVVDDIAGS
jgi:hypothetical protein